METQVIIVDKDNNVIGHKNRSELTTDDIYRVSAARITDEDGNILLGQRAWTKKKNPWKRWSSVAWTLEEWETYESNIIKEIKEEIWLDITIKDLNERPIEYHESWWWKNKSFTKQFTLRYTGDKTILTKQDEEVEELRWFSPHELKGLVDQNHENFTPSIARKLQEFSLR